MRSLFSLFLIYKGLKMKTLSATFHVEQFFMRTPVFAEAYARSDYSDTSEALPESNRDGFYSVGDPLPTPLSRILFFFFSHMRWHYDIPNALRLLLAQGQRTLRTIEMALIEC